MNIGIAKLVCKTNGNDAICFAKDRLQLNGCEAPSTAQRARDYIFSEKRFSSRVISRERNDFCCEKSVPKMQKKNCDENRLRDIKNTTTYWRFEMKKQVILFIIIFLISTMLGSLSISYAAYAPLNTTSSMYDGGGSHQHSFGPWTAAGTGSHIRNCRTCGYRQSGNHSLRIQSNGASGHVFKCSLCAYSSYTESHSFGSWTSISDSSHRHTCSKCGYSATASHNIVTSYSNSGCTVTKRCSSCNYSKTTTSHNWDNGTITTQPTCTATGVKTFHCTRDSSHTYTTSVPANGHIKPATWASDATNHYKNCTVCNARLETVAHTWGPYQTTGATQHNRTCTVCNYISAGTNHNFTTSYVDDGNGLTHKKKYLCSDCGQINYDPSENHTIETQWSRTDTHHWHVCTLCGYKKDYGEHVDVNQDEVCDICQMNIPLVVTITASIDNENDILNYTVTGNAVPANPVTKYELYYANETTPFATINTNSNSYTGTLNPATRFVFGNRQVKVKGTRQDNQTAQATTTVSVLMIRTRADLVQLATNVNGGNSYEGYTLYVKADINMGGSGSGSFTPIGTSTNSRSFDGTFDGQNHTISNLYINGGSAWRQGLFGFASAKSTIRNFTITGSITSTGTYIGGACGQSYGIIENITSSVNITVTTSSGNCVGGVVGMNSKIIRNCTYTGNISGTRAVGGIVGKVDNVTLIENCTVGISGTEKHIDATHCTNGDTGGAADDKTAVGGIVGYVLWNNDHPTNLTIRNCVSYAQVRATGGTNYRWGTGGIVGWCNSNLTIENTEMRNAVAGQTMTAGILGMMILNPNGNNEGVIDNCHNYGEINSTGNFTGGIASYSTAKLTIRNCTNNAKVATTNGFNVGGILGTCDSVTRTFLIENCVNSGKIETARATNNSDALQLNTGGIIGRANGIVTIRNCQNNATVEATQAGAYPGMTSMGGIVGIAEINGNVSIYNSTNVGNVLGARYVGGVVGLSRCPIRIENCDNGSSSIANTIKGTYTYSTIDYLTCCAGILGGAWEASSPTKITGCNNYGKIQGAGTKTSDSENGAHGFSGICSYISGVQAEIRDCNNYGNLTSAGNYYVAGILACRVNINSSQTSTTTIIDNCHNYASIKGAHFVAGIFGVARQAASGTTNTITITNCTNSQPINSTIRYAGGIAGGIGTGWQAIMEDCTNYSTGAVTMNWSNTSDQYVMQSGGIVGFIEGGPGGRMVRLRNEADVTMTNSACKANNVGGIAGKMNPSSNWTMEECVNTGNITGCSSVGGLVGWNAWLYQITDSHNEGNIVGRGQYVGGLMGLSSSAERMTACTNTGTVTGSTGYVGGLIGFDGHHAKTITRCMNSGNVTSTSGIAGGLLGSSGFEDTLTGSTINKCYNEGNVTTGAAACGGIVGSVNQKGNIQNVYNVGTVRGAPTTALVGGIVGNLGANSTLKYAYNAGTVTNSSSGNTAKKGGVIGTSNTSNTLRALYYLSTVATKGVYTGTNTTTAKAQADLANDAMIDLLNDDQVNKVWGRIPTENNGYPILQVTTAFVSISGDGVEVSMPDQTFIYDGTAKEVELNVTLGNYELKKDLDYELIYENNINVGTATVKVQGIGNFKDYVTKSFTITTRPIVADVGIVRKRPTDPEPAYTITWKNTVSGQTPGTSGELSREGLDSSNPNRLGTYAVISGDMVLIDNEPFLANNYTYTVTGQLIIESEHQSHLMQREQFSDDASYMIGAYRAGLFNYTSDLVSEITLVNMDDITAIPSNAVDSWDASQDLDGSVVAWVVAEDNNYHLYIGAEGSIIAPANSTNLFSGYIYATEINNLNNLDTSSVTNMTRFFANLETILNIDISTLNTTAVTNMSGLFEGCTSLENTDFSTLDTNGVTNMSNMFKGCYGFTELDVSTFDTSSVTNMSGMFEQVGEITTLDLRNFKTSTVTNMNRMFAFCDQLSILVLGPNFTKINGENIFQEDYCLYTIIAQRATAMTLSANANPTENTILYVPSTTAETAYQSASNYSSVFGNDRICPMLELIGEDSVKIYVGTSYTDDGVMTAGFFMGEDGNITPPELRDYGYQLSRTSDLDKTIAGTYHVTYTLSLDGNQVMQVAREIEVVTVRDISAYDAYLEPDDYVYDGQGHQPEIKIINERGNWLVLNRDFEATYTGDVKNAGTVTVTITGKSPTYTGTKVLSYQIRKRKIEVIGNGTKIFAANDPQHYSYILGGFTTGGGVSGEEPSGVVPEEQPQDISTIFTGDIARWPGESLGTYPFIQGTLALRNAGLFIASNYELVVTGEFTITGENIPPKGTINIVPQIVLEEVKYTGERVVTIEIDGSDNITEKQNLLMSVISEEDIRAMSNQDIVWQPFSETTTYTLQGDDGLKRLWLVIKDQSGNQNMYLKIDDAITYEITYNPNAGDDVVTNVPVTQMKDKNRNLILSSEIPERIGYRFRGWATTANAQEIEYAAGATYNRNSDIELFAVWGDETATLTYNSNGHGNNPSPVSLRYSQATTAVNMTTTGYTLASWNTEEDGTGTSYAVGATVKPANVIPQDITLYAQWNEVSATLTYNANGHGTAPSAVSMKYSQLVNAAVPGMASGWAFNGWNTKANGSGQTYRIGDVVKAPNVVPTAKILYAQWGPSTINMTITRVDYDTFSWTAQNNITGIAYSNTYEIPTVWTTTGSLNAGTVDIEQTEPKAYYVWAKNANGDVNHVCIQSYSVARTPSAVTSLTTKLENSSGTAFTNTTYVLEGTPIWCSATITNNGYENITINARKDGTDNLLTPTTGAEVIINRNTEIITNAQEKTALLYYHLPSAYAEYEPEPVLMRYTQKTVADDVIVEGRTFAKWYSNSDYTGTSYAPGATVKAANVVPTEKHLYGKAPTANTYTITLYQGKGQSENGRDKLGTIEVTYGSSVTLKAYSSVSSSYPFPYSSAYTPDDANDDCGWKFYGWASSSTSTEVAYENTATFTYTKAGNMALYAIGRRGFRVNSGIAPAVPEDPLYQYWNPYNTANRTSVQLPQPIDIGNGWTFYGYVFDNNADDTVTYAKETLEGTGYKMTRGAASKGSYLRSVYKRTATIAYDANGGTGTTANTNAAQYYNSGYCKAGTTVNAGQSISTPSFKLRACGYTKSGKDFAGWNTKADASGTTYNAGDTYTGFKPAVGTSQVTRTLYARWENHSWTEATCINPRKCIYCGEWSGSTNPSNHVGGTSVGGGGSSGHGIYCNSCNALIRTEPHSWKATGNSGGTFTLWECTKCGYTRVGGS